MSSPACACRAVQLAYGACLGEFTTCSIRCFSVDRVAAARQTPQPTCWEKATAQALPQAPQP